MNINRVSRFILALLALVIIYALSWAIDLSNGSPRWGLTFSSLYASELGLDPRETYASILDDLKPQRMRLVAYWNALAPTASTTDFADLDWQIAEAENRGTEVVLAIGERTPRWPECHIPPWAAGLEPQQFETALMAYLARIVEHYRGSPAVKAWQVENEPLLSVFGECPKPDKDLLKREITHVKSMDPGRPVMVTDSGELAFWPRAAGLGDIFGTTLYRHVWNNRVGFFTHIYPPAWYALRSWLTKHVSGATETVIAELQAEPWGTGRPLADIPLDEQIEQFGLRELKGITAFAKRTGIAEIYLWGPEWWYWRKLHGDPSFWEFGTGLFTGSD